MGHRRRRAACARVVFLLLVLGPEIAFAQGETPIDETQMVPRTLRDEIDRRQATIPTPEPPTRLFAIHGGLLGTLQWLATPQRYDRSLFGTGSLDLNLLVRPA